MVLLSDFNHFFKLVKNFPDGETVAAEQSAASTHGWMQI